MSKQGTDELMLYPFPPRKPWGYSMDTLDKSTNMLVVKLSNLKKPATKRVIDLLENIQPWDQLFAGKTDTMILEAHKVAFRDYVQKRLGLMMGSIHRGARLVYNAHAWKTPRVGPSGPLSLLRGSQWRLAMAWAGIDLISNSLFPRRFRQFEKTTVNPLGRWMVVMGWTTLEKEVPGPENSGNHMAKDFFGESVDQMEFLGVQDGAKKKVLKSWLIEGIPIRETASALRLCECFRDLASHGLLSASRAEKLGLGKFTKGETMKDWKYHHCNVFSRLLDVLGDCAFRTNCLVLSNIGS